MAGQPGYNYGPIELLGAAQDFTASWVDVGSEIQTEGYKKIALYIQLDINSSQNARIKLLAKTASAAAVEYDFVISTLSTTDTKVNLNYVEFDSDADQNVVLSFDLDNLIPWVQVQTQAGTVGATAGKLTTVYYILGN